MKHGLAFLAVVLVGSLVSASSVHNVVLWDTYDTHGHTNFLYRGGNPDNGHNDEFNYDQLVSQMKSLAKAAGKEFPSSFYMYDITFLNDYKDDQIQQNTNEFQYWQENPDKGEWVFWETFGQNDDPLDQDLEASYQKRLAKQYKNWNAVPVDWRVEKFREYLTDGGSTPVVIYGHCDCGCDRTGYMFGSYAMKYLNYSWHKVSHTDQQIAGRNISCSMYRGMMWYCYYLKYELKDQYASLDCGHSYQTDCNDVDSVEKKEEEKPLPESSSVKNVFYVDSHKMANNTKLVNFLFRGGDPDLKSGYNFDYNSLVASLQAAAKDAGKTLPSNFLLYDISTFGISKGHDVFRSQNEYKYFSENPTKGVYHQWEVYGEHDDPLLGSRPSDRFHYMVDTYKRWSHDLLTERISRLHSYLHTEASLPYVVYVHDDNGYTQVSDLMGAYSLQELGMSWDSVWKYNMHIADSHTINCEYYLAVQWYCYYLKDVVKGDYKDLTCSDKVQSGCHQSS